MNNLRKLRKAKGISQASLASQLNVAQNTISQWELGTRDVDSVTLKVLSDFYGCSVDYLLGYSRDRPASPGALKVRVFGNIPAGAQMETAEDTEDCEEVPATWGHGGKEYFGLKIRGDSMSPTYLDGDTIIFLKTPVWESGQDCCVIVDGADSTFRRVFKQSAGITLQPLNPAYEACFYTNAEVESLPVIILGTVKELRRRIN